MPNVVIVGAQWGDEGKAKVIDYLTERSDVVIRFQGGANAGHTVIVDGDKFIFHMVPSGIMSPGKVCIVGNGVVFDVQQFFNEVDALKAKSVLVDGRLFVSDQAHLVLPYHKALDQASEKNMAGDKIGTTGRGIGPAYADKATRTGLRVGELARWDAFTKRLSANFEAKKFYIETYLKGTFPLSLDAIIEEYRAVRERLMPYVIDTATYIHEAARESKRLLFEGAQGTFLDIDHGTYPFVTSSNTTAGAACTGSGLGPTAINHVVGIVKTYTTRVGNGPFPTELKDALGEKIREVGKEYGATTGRPRRCGWLDTVMVRKAVELNGLTRLALTKLDVLSDLPEVKICTHYSIDGKMVATFPSDPSALERVVPVYETLPGWQGELSKCSKLSDLPPNALRYIERLKELCYRVPILMVSTGPDRMETIEVEKV